MLLNGVQEIVEMWARGAGVSATMMVVWALPILLGALLSPANADLASQGLSSLTKLSYQVLNKRKLDKSQAVDVGLKGRHYYILLCNMGSP